MSTASLALPLVGLLWLETNRVIVLEPTRGEPLTLGRQPISLAWLNTNVGAAAAGPRTSDLDPSKESQGFPRQAQPAVQNQDLS